MATVYVEDRGYEMNPEENLLHQCLSLGFDLPYFCWHPALGSVGACRQCAVKQFKDESDKKGRLVMACMTAASNGTRISIKDPEAAAFRAGIIEGMMLSHPHDCPVCDEGGECHLQDMTVMTGHDYRRYRFDKRTFRNQYLGPFLNHEMNRCIQCYRCVRFYREYAGGTDFNAFALRNLVYFGRDRDGVLDNEFAGNLVEVCPTGVFTDATLKQHYTRKWDLQLAPSVCTHCGIGCNISMGSRYGMLRRVVNRYSADINGYFICDRGRYAYEFVNSEHRVRHSRLGAEVISGDDAKVHLRRFIDTGSHVIGIGSPRASLESNFALRKLVGADCFYAGVPRSELNLLHSMLDVLNSGPRTPSLREIESCDAVLILGEDVTNVAPRMALTLRQTARQQPIEAAKQLKIPLWQDHGVRELLQGQTGPFFIAATSATRLDDIATECYQAPPDDLARVGFAIAHALDERAPEPADLTESQRVFVRNVAEALKAAKRPLVVSGPSQRSQHIIQAAANIARALPGGALSFLTPECNSFGLAMMTEKALEDAVQAQSETAIVLENDLYRRLPGSTVDAFFSRGQQVIALDHLENRTTAKAGLLLPAAPAAESDGTLVNNEGRAQRFFRVLPPPEAVRQSWEWLGEWESIDRVLADLAAEIPALSPAVRAAPPAGFRMVGARVPRESHRYSGRTAILANISVSEPKPPEDTDSPLSFSMEGASLQPPPALIPYFWSAGWNSIQAVNKYQEKIAGPLRGGSSGVRLIAPEGDGIIFFTSIPTAFEARDREWLLVPLFHIFGSEELSRRAPAIAELTPDPYIALSAEDAAEFGPEAAVFAQRLPVRVIAGLAHGVAGYPANFLPLEGLELPLWTEISRV
ncbi:MAG TPA: NADH-quinone oxidoreductase subunit NuoG [Bryobacteraceae bacterium]